jgi:hypothetical protein
MIPANNEEIRNLDMEVIVSEEDATVYVKLTGFETIESADEYAAYLADKLPLLLFETDNIQ